MGTLKIIKHRSRRGTDTAEKNWCWVFELLNHDWRLGKEFLCCGEDSHSALWASHSCPTPWGSIGPRRHSETAVPPSFLQALIFLLCTLSPTPSTQAALGFLCRKFQRCLGSRCFYMLSPQGPEDISNEEPVDIMRGWWGSICEHVTLSKFYVRSQRKICSFPTGKQKLAASFCSSPSAFYP